MSSAKSLRPTAPFPSLSDVDLRLLRIFDAVVRNNGFSAAQYELNMGQPAISMYMRQLEDRLGVRLCERGRSGFKLSEGGRVVHDALQKLLRAAASFRSDVETYKGELVGRLCVAMDDATATNPKAPFRRAFGALARNAPGVELHMTIAPPGEMEVGLAEERFHLAIGPFHELPDHLAMFPIYTEKQILCCGRTHPLFGTPDNEVKTEQIERALYAARSHMDGSTLIDGVVFRNTACAPYMETIALLILSGEYIGYLPRHFAQTWIERDEMWPLAVGNLSYDSQFSVAARKSLVYPAATYLLQQLRRESAA